MFCLLVLSFFTCIVDILSAFGNSPVYGWPVYAKDLCNYGYLGLHGLMSYFACRYVIVLTGTDYEEKQREYPFVTVIPVACMMGILFSNIAVRWVFYYNEKGFYRHGVGYYFFLVFVYIYFVFGLLLLLNYGHFMKQPVRLMACALLAICLAALIFQSIFPMILIQLCVESLCLLGAVVTLENQDEILDISTGCYNRKSFFNDFQLYWRTNRKFRMIFIKTFNMNRYVMGISDDKMSLFKRQMGSFLLSLDTKALCYYTENDYYVMICDSNCDTATLIEKIRTRFAEGWRIEDYRLEIPVQVEDASVPEEIVSPEEVLMILSSNARELPKDDKTTDMEKTITKYRREMELEDAIRRGLRYEDIEIYYQPVWEVGTNRIAYGEAFVRLTDKKLGVIPPTTIIDIAKKKGMDRELEKYVLEKVCSFIVDHPLDGVGLSHISTNLSKSLMLDVDFYNVIENTVDRTKVRREKIGIEFEGTAAIRNNSNVFNSLKKLQEKGYHMTMESFGSGGTAMTDLADFPIDSVKIDSSMLQKAINSKKSYVVLSDALRTCRRLGLSTTAVGVESEEEKQILTNLGCDYLQGNCFVGAMTADEFYHYCVGFNKE